jgi:N-acetylmuramoyl-L-alanine amidase
MSSNAAIQKKPVIVIDAGHGGYDTGGIGPMGSREKINTLAVALKLGAILTKRNVKVVYTRTTDKVPWPSIVKLDLLHRASISNNSGADVFISIHNNSSTYKSVRGTEIYYSRGSSKGRRLAGLIQNQIIRKAGTRDRGIRGDEFIVLQKVSAPSVLVELGYISNKSEEELLRSSAYQQKFAEAMAEGIMLYMK